MPGVKFILEADEAKAVRGFLKILAANNKLNKGIKQTTKSLAKMEKQGQGAGRRSKLGSFGKTFATAFGVGTGAGALRAGLNLLQGMARSSREITVEIGRSNAAFDRIVRPTAALADNAANIAGIRSEIIATSVGFGIEAQNVASGLFLLDSALGDFDDTIKGAIKRQALMTAALGGDFNVAISAGASLWLIYGKQMEAAGIEADDMVGKLSKIADLAKATPEQIGKFGLRTFAAGKARGFGFQDVGAVLPFATGISGSARVAATKVANVINRISIAEQELGIVLEGGLLDQLEQVRDAVAGDINLTAKVFSRELAAFAQQLLENVDRFRSDRKKIGLADKKEQAQKLAIIRADPVSRQAEIFRTGEATLASLGAIRGGQDPKLLQQALNFQALKIGTRLTTSPFLQLTQEKLQDLQLLITSGKVGAANPLVQKGFRFREDQARAAGDQRFADLIRVQSGGLIPGVFRKITRKTAIDVFGGQTFTRQQRFTPGIAQEFAERQRDDPSLTLPQFVRRLQTDAAFREEIIGPGPGAGAFTTSQTSVLIGKVTGPDPVTEKKQLKKIGQGIGEGMQGKNVNVGVQP